MNTEKPVIAKPVRTLAVAIRASEWHFLDRPKAQRSSPKASFFELHQFIYLFIKAILCSIASRMVGAFVAISKPCILIVYNRQEI